MLCFLSWWVLKAPGKVRTRQPHMCTWKNSFFSITLSVTPHRASHMLPLRPKRCYFDRTSTSDFESYINKLAKIICWGSPPRVTIVQRHPQKTMGTKMLLELRNVWWKISYREQLRETLNGWRQAPELRLTCDRVAAAMVVLNNHWRIWY